MHETAVDCRMAAIVSVGSVPGGYSDLAYAPSADGYWYPSAHNYYRYTSRVQPHFRVAYHTKVRRVQ